MGLNSSLNIGATGLGAAQIAIQVTGNNLANAATPGYSRQIARLSPLAPQNFGRFSVGTGVKVGDVSRQVDDALQRRLWQAIADESAASQQSGGLGQLEAILDELGDRSVSNQLRQFFGSWSERANLTQSSAVVIQQGASIADFLKKMRADIARQGDNGDQQLGAIVERANGILTQIASLNVRIADFEAGGAQASTLRDQRDELITTLSESMDVTAVEQPSGAVDILVGSTPVVLGATSRGIQVARETRGTGAQQKIELSVRTRDDNSMLCIEGGQIGGILSAKTDSVGQLVNTLDTITTQLIYALNALHSTGTPSGGYTTMSASLSVPAGDRSRALNDPANVTLADLPWKINSGGFTVNVTGPTGAKETVRVNIDLDGRRSDGTVGFDDDTSLDDIVSQLDAINGLAASVGPDGKLKIDAEPGFKFSMSDDSAGALPVLGVNAFFTGRDARDIAVRPDLRSNPTLLGTGRLGPNGQLNENGTALAIAQLRDAPQAALGGRSIQQMWGDSIQQVGVEADAAKGRADAAKIVRDSLQAQRDAISGVSVDEESINLINYQRMYQGSARFISVVDELTNTLLNIV